MKANFIILAVANQALLATAATTGLLVDGARGYTRHFYLGVLSALFTCFVHVLVFMYFVVQQKIMDQAVIAGEVIPAFRPRVASCKQRTLRLSAVGMVAIMVVSVLGAAIESGLASTIHMIAAYAVAGLHVVLFAMQYAILAEYRGIFREAFNE